MKDNNKKSLTGKELVNFMSKHKSNLTKEEWDEVEKRIKSFRRSFNKRMNKTRKYMEEARKLRNRFV